MPPKVPTTEAECTKSGGTWVTVPDGGGGICVKYTKKPVNQPAIIEMTLNRAFPCEDQPIVINITRLTRPQALRAARKKRE
jgi:hypothetical protein